MILPTTLSPLPVCPSGDDPVGESPLDDFVAAGAVRQAILGTSELPVVEVLPVDDFDDCFAGRADFPLPKRASAAKWRPRQKAQAKVKANGSATAPAAASTSANAKKAARAQVAADLGIHLSPDLGADLDLDLNLDSEPAEMEIPDMALETPVVHPAFEVIPPATRRAAPPQLQPRERAGADCEAAYGSNHRTRGGERWWVIGMGLAACAVLFSGTLVDFISREAMRRSQVQVEALALPAKLKAAHVNAMATGTPAANTNAPAGPVSTARAGAAAIPTADEKALPLAATAGDDDKPE